MKNRKDKRNRRAKFYMFVIFMFFMVIITGCAKKDNSLQAIKDGGKITVVTNALFPPFEYYKSDKVEGVDMDIAKEVAKDLGVKLEILDMDFDGVIAAIASGKGDFVAAGLSYDKEREKAISFSDEYIDVPQSLIVLKDGDLDDNIEILKGKKVGTQIGTTVDQNIRNEIKDGFLKDKGTKLIAKKDYLGLVTDLRNNRLDVIALDGLIARQLVNKNKDLKYFDINNESYSLAVKKGNEDLLKEINKTINKLRKNGKINEFYKNHYEYIN